MTSKLLNPVRKVTLWLEGFAGKPHAAIALFSCAFIEASVFPLPPDVLLIALGVTRPRRSILYSLLVVCGSSMGALLGYYLGYAVFDAVGSRLMNVSGAGGRFESLLSGYHTNAWLVLFLAGFTSIPFMVFTVAAGFNSTVDLPTLVFGVLCGRIIRFLPIGFLLVFFGARVKYYIDHYLHRFVVIIGLAVILFIAIVWSTS